MSDPNELQAWHCPGSSQPPAEGSRSRCRGCGQVRSRRLDGMIQKHPKPGEYHPNKKPKPKTTTDQLRGMIWWLASELATPDVGQGGQTESWIELAEKYWRLGLRFESRPLTPKTVPAGDA